MALIKLGEATTITEASIQDSDVILSDADLKIVERMKKFASELKTIAPQAKDFLYFTAVMMHAAEAALLDEHGNLKKDAHGNPVSAHWEKVGDGIKWVCTDPNIKPYANSNRDIFPESELKLAYPKWVGKPLCLDHKSSSVDMIRGVIVDTYWDESRKRIIALCALDKVNYPDLARKVTSAYATNVSMGTAVGRAVCTEDGCHRVARVEHEFCDHMRRRSCYGEINLDLSPIELSIVVTGADPKAKVKHIIAKDLSEARKAASALQDYLDGKIALASADTTEVSYIKEELSKLTDRVNKLATSFDSNGGSSEETAQQSEAKVIETTAAESFEIELAEARAKLSSINNTLDKLNNLLPRGASTTATTNNEETMTEKKAYWQGTTEPTPGKAQYTPDPLLEKARMEDKHMVGKKPFPEVGDVEGLYPGDAEVKERMQRLAEAEQRERIRRAAVEEAKKSLEARAYWQGTTEPTPGKVKYTPDPLLEKARMEDKHMVGKKPFPEVGKVDGLYGDDLATKEKLSRAGLNAKFKTASFPDGKLNKAASSWNVYAGDHLILTASVDEITRGNEAIYEAVATKDFGKSIIRKIKTEGFEAARAQFKGAQAAPAPAGDVPAVPGEELGLPEVGGPEADLAPSGDDVKDSINQAIDSLNKALKHLDGGADAVAEDAAEMPMATAAPTDEAEFAKASLASMRRTVNGLLEEGFREVTAKINAHKKELETAKVVVASKYDTMPASQKVYFVTLVNDALRSAKQTVAEDSRNLMEAFVRYAQGTDAVIRKEAQVPEIHMPEMVITPEEKSPEEVVDGVLAPLTGPKADELKADDKKKSDKKDDEDEDEDKDEDKKDKKDEDKDEDKKDKKDKKDEDKDEDKNDASVVIKPEDLAKLPGDTTITVASSDFDMTTKEGRAMYREKIAQKGVQFMKMPADAHKDQNGIPGGFQQPKDNLGKVEKLEEISKAMNDLANMAPQVRKQAERLIELAKLGSISVDDADALVAEGVDKEAVQYFKKYWAEAKDSDANEFATLLTKEKVKAAAAEAEEAHRVKVIRAHDLAYQMRDKGMIDTAQIPQQVEAILSWNDAGFTAVKNIVAKSESTVKTASIPQVGLLSSEELYIPSQQSAPVDLVAAFDAHFSKKRY